LNGASIDAVMRRLARHPVQSLVRRWNWKSAVLSAMVRSTLFFIVNINAGIDAARDAFVTEIVFRSATAGFYGALTQALRDIRPFWVGTVAVMALLPLTTHLLEFLIHWLRGTARLASSLEWSVAFTALSTSFNLFAMRRGAFVVGRGGESIFSDLRRVPRLAFEFLAGIPRGLWRVVKIHR
jgi:hypothetical protein